MWDVGDVEPDTDYLMYQNEMYALKKALIRCLVEDLLERKAKEVCTDIYVTTKKKYTKVKLMELLPELLDD